MPINEKLSQEFKLPEKDEVSAELMANVLHEISRFIYTQTANVRGAKCETPYGQTRALGTARVRRTTQEDEFGRIRDRFDGSIRTIHRSLLLDATLQRTVYHALGGQASGRYQCTLNP